MIDAADFRIVPRTVYGIVYGIEGQGLTFETRAHAEEGLKRALPYLQRLEEIPKDLFKGLFVIESL